MHSVPKPVMDGVCASVTMNAAAGINLYHGAFCQFFPMLNS